MREIKFRAFDERNNEMVYSDKEDAFYINTKGALFMYGIKSEKDGIRSTKYHHDYGLMQYTGLKDKNGVEIYENDLVELMGNKNGVLQVFFVNAYVGGWVCAEASDTDHTLSLGARNQLDIKVVGNIHSNPELLNR